MRLAILLVCLNWLAQSTHSLDRNLIRQAIIERRFLLENGLSTINSEHLRLKRQTFPRDSDDEDDLGVSGDTTTEPTDTTPHAANDRFWVWYRTELNFLESIIFTKELQDHNSEEFLDLSGEIMFDMEEYLSTKLPGYLEATPVMFAQKEGYVMVFVDVGTCSDSSAQSIKDAVLSMLESGMLGRFYISPEHFKMKQIGVDHERQECASVAVVASTAAFKTTTTVVVPSTEQQVTRRPSATTTTTEPTPPDANEEPDFDAIISVSTSRPPVVGPRTCRPSEATCANGQCIDRIYVCDGSQDCWDGSDEASCSNGINKCDPTQFLCVGTGVCAQKHWRCDGDDDCGNGFDEQGCSTEKNGVCLSTQFQCDDNKCVPSSYHCDGEQDCAGGEDEKDCSPPVVIIPPVRIVNAKKGDTVTLDCEAVGTPTPVISWRVNWGNVPPPPRVAMTSQNGRGQLTIKKVKLSDQGAYTCEAINRNGAILAVPDAVLVVEDTGEDDDQPSDCLSGEFNSAGEGESPKCEPCYCFGVTDQCASSKLIYDEVGISFTEPKVTNGVHLEPVEVEGGIPGSPEPINRNQISVNPAAKELQLIDLSKRFLAAAHYWSLPAQFLGAKINSYGGTLEFSFSYNNSYNFTPKPTNNSDVILQGNGETLVYRDPGAHPEPVGKHQKSVGLDEEGWKTAEGKPASREDMMKVLGNLSSVLLRTVYDSSMLSTGIGDVSMQVAKKSETTEIVADPILIATRVEDCECPEGYTGLSCQDCDVGFERQHTGPYVGKCLKLQSDDSSPAARLCDAGYTGVDCDECDVGYQRYEGGCTRYPDTYCDTAGSIGLQFPGQPCNCKTGCEGVKCDRCKPGYFHLTEQNPEGCLSCFCMGVSDQCNSTKWNRTSITPDFQQQEVRFLLTNEAASTTFPDHVRYRSGRGDDSGTGQPRVVAHLDRLAPDVYYWMLPEEFLGNQLASYGGNFDFTIRYSDVSSDARPMSRGALVRLLGKGVTLDYVSEVHPPVGDDTRYMVPITEEGWVKSDGSPATREDMLLALNEIESLLVRATYSSQMRESTISSIYLDSATDQRTGRPRAFEVEQCRCPEGYSGLSCEECTTGYHRVLGGDYLGRCEPCNCHGHSSECNPRSGVCQNCRHNTVGEHCEECAVGYYGDARTGGAFDCLECPCPPVERGIPATCSRDSRGHVTCDLCPEGHEGDRCERCAEGFDRDPLELGSECHPVEASPSCGCNPSGSTDGSCDTQGRCNCKQSTQGMKCDRCKPGFFHLNVEEEGGCIPCFCMGLTRQCTSASYQRNKVTSDFREDDGGFSLTNKQVTVDVTSGFEVLNGGRSLSHPSMDSLQPGVTFFWKLPEEYLGDKIVSYGGRLEYTVSYTSSGGIPVNEPDVVLMGNDIILFSSISGEVQPNTNTQRLTVFREAYWRTADRQPATREHLLMALADVEQILIRATHSSSTLRSTISDVSMETASENALMAEPAYEVEQCECPDGYEGLSCEDCAPGYTRSGGGTYLGLCHSCQCNGRADICDTETGVCIDCQDNTSGDHCELCAPGYYGNPRNGDTCRPCSCPGTGSNSFSSTCEYNSAANTLTCTDCEEGYTGLRCENCDTGYQGNPTAPGGSCVKIVRPPTVRPGDVPQVRVDPKSVNAEPGNNVILRCIVDSDNRVRVSWRRPGNSLPRGAVLSDSGRILTLNSLTSGGVGTYRCEAANRYGTGSDSAVITLARPQPMIQVKVEEPRSVTAQVGSDVSFVCNAISSNNMPFVRAWHKRGGRLPSRATDFRGILTLRDVQLTDSGSYVCTGSNFYGISQDSAVLKVTQGDPSPISVVVTPNNQSVMKGDDVIFYCSADGTPTPQVQWHRADGHPMQDNVEVVGEMLRIPSASMADKAMYYCTASNEHGTAEATGALEVFDGLPPSVTVLTPEVTLTIGESGVLNCSAVGEPQPEFSWQKRGRMLPPNTFEEGGVLRIDSAVTNNDGIYQCTAGNAFGIDNGFIHVNIVPQVPAEKPICRTEPAQVTAYVGTNSTSICHIGGNPPPKITWERADGIPLDSNIVVHGNKLTIVNVVKSNAGVYFCVAANDGGVTKSKMTLQVVKKDLPNVHIGPAKYQRVFAGESAQFSCNTNESDADITWVRNNQQQFTGHTSLTDNNHVIKFGPITVAEAGYYVCLASNAVGHREVSVYLEVLQRPIVEVLPARLITLRQSEPIVLTCKASGKPKPSVIWQRLNATRNGSPQMLTRYRQGSNLLEIKSAQLSDAGEYACLAINEAGDSTVKVVIKVHATAAYEGPRVTVESQEKRVTAGGTLQLHCVASGTPTPMIKWTKEGQELPAGAEQSDGVLRIPNFTDEDSGKYLCTAYNVMGRSQEYVRVETQYPPSLDIEPSPTIHLIESESITINCKSIGDTQPVAYTWTKDVGSFSTSVLTSGAMLRITGFVPDTDAGTYTCTGVNDAGQSTRTLTILKAAPPVVEVRHPNVTVTLGESAVFHCDVVNDVTDVSVSWARLDGMDFDDTRTKVNDEGRLRIDNVQLSDAAEYECVATNLAGSAIASAVLIVQAPPVVTLTVVGKSEGEILVEGTGYQISCQAGGIPEPTVTLTKDNVNLTLDEAGVHTIVGTRNDSGIYVCSAVNSVGTSHQQIEVSIYGPPKVVVLPPSSELRSHDTLRLECDVESSLETNISWSKLDGNITTNSSTSSSSLVLEDIGPDDGGIYVCSATNAAGTTHYNINVPVHSFIPFFSQTERSYLSHSLPDNSFYTSFRILISFRPNALDGLLLYAASDGSDFISLNLAEGFLDLRFDLGSGPVTIRSASSVEKGQWHTVVVSREGKKGQVQVDGGEVAKGQSPGGFRGLELTGPLYVGGLPREMDNQLPLEIQSLGPDLGFYGCISQLEIGSGSIDMGSGAQVKRVGVVRCKTCGASGTESPCHNGAECTETYKAKKGRVCRCPTGVVGADCQFIEADICKEGSCGKRGECRRDLTLELGHRCVCEIGFSGPKCEQAPHVVNPHPNVPINSLLSSLFDHPPPRRPRFEARGRLLTIENPENEKGASNVRVVPGTVSFSKDSYMMTTEVQASEVLKTDIRMRIKRNSRSDGLLLFNRDEEGSSAAGEDFHFLSLAIRDNSLEFRFSWGTETAIIKSPRSVLGINTWHNLKVMRRSGKGRLVVDGKVVAKATASGFGLLGVNGPMFLGGVRYWDGVAEKVRVRDGFDGCVTGLRINKRHVSFDRKFQKKRVGTCERQESDSTDAGFMADIAANGLLASAARTSARFIGSSYVAFPRSAFMHDGQAEQLSLTFRSTNPEGLIFFHGMDLTSSNPGGAAVIGNNDPRRSGQLDFVSLGLQSSYLVYRYNLGGGSTEAVSIFPVADGQWHHVTIVRRGSLVLMWLDDVTSPVTVQSTSSHSDLNAPGRVYLGGSPRTSQATDGYYSRGFIGCLKDVRLTSVPASRAHELGSRFLDDSQTPPLGLGRRGTLKRVNIRNCRSESQQHSFLVNV